MANRLNWSIGNQGKGNWYKNGDLSTWNVDEHLNPHHSEVAMREQNEPGFYFHISPTGGISDGSLGFNNQSPYTDDQLIREIVAQDPALYDGRNEEDFEEGLEPRVELPEGGYGHAYNLLKLMSKIAAGDNWADFHTELKLPRGVRKKIRRWVDRLKWPEGSEKEDARRYHITILSMDEYDDEFAKWAHQQMQGKLFTFKTIGMDIFADEHVVLRLDCPEWTELVLKWQDMADDQGLKPRKYDPPKAHVTIGKSPEGKWPRGIPDPHLKFDTRQFNVNKNSSWHLAQETTIADELKQWLDSFTPTQEEQPLSLHHTDADQFQPEIVTPQSIGPHVDPPSKPYKPYNWAEQGWEGSPLDWIAREGANRDTHECPNCGAELDAPICATCGYDPTALGSEYQRIKNNWYDRAWSEPGNQPRPLPHQPLLWGDRGNATDIKVASLPYVFHVAPANARAAIAQEGLKHGLNPDRIYAFGNEDEAKDYAVKNADQDIYRINVGGLPLEQVENTFPLRRHPALHPNDPDAGYSRDVTTYGLPPMIEPNRVERLGHFVWSGKGFDASPVWIEATNDQPDSEYTVDSEPEDGRQGSLHPAIRANQSDIEDAPTSLEYSRASRSTSGWREI